MARLVKSAAIWFITSRQTVRLYLWGTAVYYLISHFAWRKNWIGLACQRNVPGFVQWMKTLEITLLNSTRIRRLQQQGLGFPAAQTWFITGRCNQNCPGCPTQKGAIPDTMTENDWVRLGEESIRNGSMMILMLGGEPMLKKDTIKNIVKRLGNETIFMVFTNGDLVTAQDMDDFRKLGIALAINLGSGRKGDEGAYRALKLAKEHGVVVGASVTVTEENYQQVTSQSFINHLAELGAIFAFHFHYVPVGVPDDAKYLLSEQSFWQVEKNLVAICGPLKVIHYSQCRAAESYISIAPNGDVRLCAFCTGSASFGNVKESALLDIFNNEAVKSMRRLNTSNACMVLEHTDELVRQGHIPAAVAEAVRSCQYPRSYIRRPLLLTRISIYMRNLAWGRVHRPTPKHSEVLP